MADSGEPIFQSTLHVQKTAHQAVLTSSHFIWEPASKGGPLDSPSTEPLFCHKKANVIPLTEIIAAKHEKESHKSHQLSSKKNKTISKDSSHLYIELQCPTFVIYILKKGLKHKWKYKKLSFVCQDSYLCTQWINHINGIIAKPEFKRPKHLLVFINPYGGKRQAHSIYHDKVAPLFELAGIKTEVIVTQRHNHARDTLHEHELEKVDGVVCVGGDGMFSELLNGLCERKLKEAGLEQTLDQHPLPPDLKIGIIPAGSTDCIVYTTTGINDPVTSALHIILGNETGVDVCSVYSGEKFERYSVSMLAYGYYGDILIDSEKNRWMGPKRYQLSGAKKFLGNKAYPGEVTFRLAPDSESNPRDKKKCLKRCNVCKLAGDRVDHKHVSHMNKDGTDGVHKFKGKFVAICSFTISCMSGMTPAGASPHCHLGDGTTDLMLVQECSRFKFLKHLMRIADKSADQFDFDFIKIYRVKEFSFHPLTEPDEDQEEDGATGGTKHTTLPRSRTSVWNCDGEVIQRPALQVRVHCQLVRLFAGGIEDMESSPMCSSCCSLGEPPDSPL